MLQSIYKGLLLAVVIGLLSYFGAGYIPGVNAVLLSFLIGVLLGNVSNLPPDFSKGISFSSSKVLEASIVLMAFGISFGKISSIGTSKFALIVILITALLLITVFISKRFSGTATTNWLVGFGTAICGSSAIAALAPAVTDNKEEIGISIAIVNLIGSLGMVIMPLLLVALNVSDTQSSAYIGASLHSVGNVMGAGYEINPAVGASALTLKLARVALLSPAIIFFKIISQQGERSGWRSYLKLPNYLWAFIAITVFVSFVSLPTDLLKVIDTAGKLLLIIAMAGIGLKVSLKQLIVSGKKAISFGLLIFAIQLALISLLLFFL